MKQVIEISKKNFVCRGKVYIVYSPTLVCLYIQVNQLDKVRGEDNSSASSGDAVIRAKDLLEQLKEIENEIGQLHKSRGRKLRCSYYNSGVQ